LTLVSGKAGENYSVLFVQWYRYVNSVEFEADACWRRRSVIGRINSVALCSWEYRVKNSQACNDTDSKSRQHRTIPAVRYAMMRTSHVFRFSVVGLKKRKPKGGDFNNKNYQIILRGEQVVLEDKK